MHVYIYNYIYIYIYKYTYIYIPIYANRARKYLYFSPLTTQYVMCCGMVQML